MTEQTYIEKIEEMRKNGSCRTSPASAKVYAAQLRAGSPLCLMAAADGLCGNGVSLLEPEGKDALDRLNRWQAEKQLSDKERAALNLLLKIHGIEPFSKRTAGRTVRQSGGGEREDNREFPLSLYNILSALRQATKNRREVAELPTYTLLMRALLLDDRFTWTADGTEQELKPGGAHYEENVQVIASNLHDPVLEIQVKNQLTDVLLELESNWDGPQLRIDVGRALGWLEADMEKRLQEGPDWADDYKESRLRLLLRHMAAMEKGLCGFLYREMEAEELTAELMELIGLSIEAGDGVFSSAASYEERKRQAGPEAVLFLAAVGCGVPVKPEVWRRKEWKETILSLIDAGLLIPDGRNLRAAEGAEREGFISLYNARRETKGRKVWQLFLEILESCSAAELLTMEKDRAQRLRLHIKTLLGQMEKKDEDRLSLLRFMTGWLWEEINGEDGFEAAEAARWILARMKEEPENMDAALRGVLKTSPKDQAIRLDRSGGVCLLEGELTDQCAQRYLKLALEAESGESVQADESRAAYWAACALSQAERARRQFIKAGAEQKEREAAMIADFARQLLPPEDSVKEIRVMSHKAEKTRLFLPWYSGVFDSTLSCGPECTQERTEAALLQILLSGQRVVLSLNQTADNEKIRNLTDIPAFLWMLRRGFVSVSLPEGISSVKEYTVKQMRNQCFVWSSLPEDFEDKRVREAAARWLEGNGSLWDLPEAQRERMARFRDAVELVDENLPDGWTAWNHQGSESFLQERGIGPTPGLKQRLLAYYNTTGPAPDGFETMKQLNRMITDSGRIDSRSSYRRAVWAVMNEDEDALKRMEISKEALKGGERPELLKDMIRVSDVCYNRMLGEGISPYQNYVYNEETIRLLPEWNRAGKELLAGGGEPVSDAGRMLYRQLDTDISGKPGGEPSVSWQQAAERIMDLKRMAEETPQAGAEKICSRLQQQGLDDYGVFGREGDLRLQKLILRASTGKTLKREQDGGGDLYHEETEQRRQPGQPKRKKAKK